MATNGANGKHTPSKRAKPLSYKPVGMPRPTAAQLRAMREYVKMTGHKLDPKRIAKIIEQWES